MGKGDYHGASHIYGSRAGTSPRAEYREFDFEPGREAEKDELLRKVEAAQFVATHDGEVCPAKWKAGSQTLKPSIDLVGKL